jgi:large subunit ribosomal protein L10
MLLPAEVFVYHARETVDKRPLLSDGRGRFWSSKVYVDDNGKGGATVPMPNANKEQAIAEIRTVVEASDALWVVDYRGLSVQQSEALRVAVRGVGASMKVYKNTLVKRVLAELGLPTLDETLAGPSAFVFVEGDPVASAKVLKDFAKTNPALEMKGGILDGKELTVEQAKAVADLPSREELIAKLLGTIQNPLSGFVRVLNGPATGLAQAIRQIAEQKSAA